MSMADLADRSVSALSAMAHRPVRTLFRRLLRVFVVCLPAATLIGVQPASAFPLLQSTGSSFAGVAIDQWVGQASSLYGFHINFQVSSSVFGLNSFAQGQEDFAASDIPYSSGQADSSPPQPYQYLPDVAGALAFMYNLQGVNGQQIKSLVLNAQTLDGIFTGKITNWNDPAIAKINLPQVALNLPNQPIVPVYREDASGENYLLSDYLLHQDGATFQAYQRAVADPLVGQPSATWPLSQTGPPAGYPNYTSLTGQNGSDGVANYVSALSSEGSIGYLETAYAIQHNFPVANLVNASGNAVPPSSLNDATALEKAVLFADLTQNLANVYSNPLPNAYPISAYSYFVAPCSPALAAAQNFSCTGPQGTSPFTPDRGAELGQFVAFLACAGQEKMALLGYSPLPPNLVQEDFNAIGRLNGGVEPPSPTAATCRNPYVDGEVNLPGGGGPVIDTSVSDAGSIGAQSVVQNQANATKAAQQAKTNSGGTTGPAGTSDGSTSPSGPGSVTSGGPATPGKNGGARVASDTRALGSPYVRFGALQGVAAGIHGPSPGLVALWCLLLVLALVVPVTVLVLWRRRAIASSPIITSIRGDV
jgi:phosphate transport system substrate-binding protein